MCNPSQAGRHTRFKNNKYKNQDVGGIYASLSFTTQKRRKCSNVLFSICNDGFDAYANE